jgi:hypothetical protein
MDDASISGNRERRHLQARQQVPDLARDDVITLYATASLSFTLGFLVCAMFAGRRRR